MHRVIPQDIMVCIFKFYHESKPHGLTAFQTRLKTRYGTVPNEWSSICSIPLRQRMVYPFKLNWLFSCSTTMLGPVVTMRPISGEFGPKLWEPPLVAKKCFVPVRGSTLDVHVHFLQSKWESICLTTKNCCLLAMRIEAAQKNMIDPQKNRSVQSASLACYFLVYRGHHTNSSKQVQHQCDDCIHHHPADSINISI